MTRYYATLYDSNYLAKGLALYFSLRDQNKAFHLYVLCMDQDCYWLMSEMSLENVTLIPLHLFETDMKMATIRSNRNWTEYCWTCASQLMHYVMQVERMELLTYLDSDLFFFRDPEVVFAEIGDKSIAIVPHHRAPHAEHSNQTGVFNVGWVTIRNSVAGMSCLAAWMQQCRAWCYNKHEEGKFGDQAYLDAWPSNFPDDICIIENRGANVAPWNLKQYELSRDIAGPVIRFNECDYPVVFYHFHQYRDARYLCHSSNPLPEAHAIIYAPYNAAIFYATKAIEHAKEKREQRMSELKAQGERV